MPPRKPTDADAAPAKRSAKRPAKAPAKVAAKTTVRAPAKAVAKGGTRTGARPAGDLPARGHARPAPLAAIPPSAVIAVSHERVACDGGGGALGHPLVYLSLGADGAAECGYCDRRFVLTPGGDVYHDPSPRAVAGH